MLERLVDYALVYGGSALKFIFGPVFGLAAHLTLIETWVLTVLGMMTTVILISLMKEEWRHAIIWKFKRNKRLFTRRNRRLVKFWTKYGLVGVAFITPVLLSPPGGALIVMSFGGSRKRMIKYMAISAVFWGFVTSGVVYFLGDVFTKTVA